jgi:ABC-type transport system involved in multi-copper enzyme maturation permease subunit
VTRTLVPVFGYTLRACVPLKRRLGLGVLCLAALGFGLLARTIPSTRDHAFMHMATIALFGLVLPLAGLVVGDAVLGAEVRAGTFHFTWLSPVSTTTIALGRWAAGTLVTAAALGPAFFLAAVVAGAPRAAGPAALAGIVGGGAYVAVFVAVGVLVRRAAVVSLALVFLIERLLGGVLTGIAQLSPMWEARAVFTGLAPSGDFFHRTGIPDGWWAVVRLAIITAVALTVAVRRLRAIKLAGATD